MSIIIAYFFIIYRKGNKIFSFKRIFTESIAIAAYNNPF